MGMMEESGECQWDHFQDLMAKGDIMMPTMSFRVVAGFNADGVRRVHFDMNIDGVAATSSEFYGMVVFTINEWMHEQMHEHRDHGGGF